MAPETQCLTAAPADKQVVEHNGHRYKTVKEGLAYILVPETPVEGGEAKRRAPKDTDGVQQVFYNPIQQFNRDLTVLAIKAYGKERMEQKKAQSRSRIENWMAKKRKWKGPAEAAEPPSKAQKLSEDADCGERSADAAVADGGEDREAARVEQQTGATSGAKVQDQDTVVGPDQEAAKDKSHRFTILDALSASGLRALRYASEIPFVTSVTANDLTKSAVESIKLNVEHNKLQDKISASHDDALAHMYSLVARELRHRQSGKASKSEKYDVIDLDPYGTAAPFLDAAVQAVRDDGGLLCVTCTDAGVWASNGYPEKCYSLYGGVPVKGWFSHEAGLRIIIHAIESSAARYGRAIEPLLSLSIDYYCRIFLRIRKSPANVKFQGGKNMLVYNCDAGCGAWTTQLLMKNKAAPNKKGTSMFYKHGFAAGPTTDRLCEHCGSTMHLAGPMYAGRIQSPPFIRSVLAALKDAPEEIYGTSKRIEGMLQTALEEIMPSREEMEMEAEMTKEDAPTETNGDGAEAESGQRSVAKTAVPKEAELAAIDPYPFFVHPAQLAKGMHCSTPPENAIRGALVGLGYRVTRSHCKPGSVKTDAPWSVLWHVMREWVRQRAPVTEENIKAGTAGHRLLGLDQKDQPHGNGAAPSPTAENGAKAQEETKKEPAVVFDENLGRDPGKNKFVRYQVNPRENWGPMNRAKGW